MFKWLKKKAPNHKCYETPGVCGKCAPAQAPLNLDPYRSSTPIIIREPNSTSYSVNQLLDEIAYLKAELERRQYTEYEPGMRDAWTQGMRDAARLVESGQCSPYTSAKNIATYINNVADNPELYSSPSLPVSPYMARKVGALPSPTRIPGDGIKRK